MKNKKLLIALLSASMVFSAGMAIAGCDDGNDPTPPPGEEQPGHTAPVITILAGTERMEIEAGEEFDPLFGVSAVDDKGNPVNVIVSDDGGFDVDTEGEYTLTYSATVNGLTSNATRVVEVLKAGSPITLEARTDRFNKPVWESGVKINFKNREYKELTESTNFTVRSGVFYNASQSEITLNVEGTHGCSAVIDKNGVVVEGRDGANSNLVNEANPDRATTSVKTLTVEGVEYSVSDVFAKELKIPAGGFAVVVQNGYAGTTSDTDGRGYMNYNVIYGYGNVVRLYWAETPTDYLTEYVDQKPTVSGNSEVLALQGDTNFVLADAVKNGLIIKDDNGTFDTSDDVTITEVTIVDDGDFDIAVAGDYVVTLSVTDGKLTTEFTRKVKVVAESDAVEVAFLKNSVKFLQSGLAVDKDLTSIGNYNLIVYTYEYKQNHETLGFTNGHGSAYVVDRYGKIVRTYDGANGRYNDAENKDQTGVVTGTNYIQLAYESLKEGETVFIAPHNTVNGNSSAGGTRNTFMQFANRTAIGAAFSCTGFEFEEKPFVLTVGSKSWTALESKYAYNQDVTAATAPEYGMIVYTKDYSGTVSLNGFGAAIVLDKFGKLVKLYDAVNGGYYENDATKLSLPANCTTSNYAAYAFENLSATETLVIFPNDGVNGADSPRTFALGLRNNDCIGAYVTLTDVTFKDPNAEPAAEMTLNIGSNNIVIESANVALNPAAAGAQLLVFTTEYSGAVFAANNGVAFVVSGGKIVRIYDGIGAKVYDADHTEGQSGVITNNNYLSAALASLQANEYLLVGANVTGSLGTDPVRKFFNDNKTLDAEVSYVGYSVDASSKAMTSLSVNGNKFFNPVIANNTEVANAANYDFAVFSYGYSGFRLTNGWSVALVINEQGKVVKVYDGIANKYFDAENSAGVAGGDYFTVATISLDAFLNLKPGETLIVGLNGGMQSNRGRAFLNSNRVVNVDVEFGGITVAAAETAKVKYMSIAMGGKTWYQNVAKVAHNEAYTGNPAFAIYDKTYDGALISGGYGVAVIIDAQGQAVKIFDGANAKYYDAEQNGVAVSGLTATNYIEKAFEAIEEGQTLVIATNGGTDGNAARAWFLANRKIAGNVLTLTFPELSNPQE